MRIKSIEYDNMKLVIKNTKKGPSKKATEGNQKPTKKKVDVTTLRKFPVKLPSKSGSSKRKAVRPKKIPSVTRNAQKM